MRRASDDRGQTAIDFVLGMGVFMIAVGFTFGFLPTMIEPFTASASENGMVAERGAAQLAESTLVADPATPNVLNAACTFAFFAENETLADQEGCRFDTTALDGALGLHEWQPVNVTVEADGSVAELEYDGTTELRRGPAPPDGEDLAVAYRLVLLEGERLQLTVRVW